MASEGMEAPVAIVCAISIVGNSVILNICIVANIVALSGARV